MKLVNLLISLAGCRCEVLQNKMSTKVALGNNDCTKYSEINMMQVCFDIVLHTVNSRYLDHSK